jgi:hypothetical protein
MDVYASSSGLQRVVAYGPHSVVLSHNSPNHHHFHSLPPQPIPKATTSYQLVPVVPRAPTTIYVPVQQQTKQPQHHHHHQQQSPGNYL